MPRYQLWILSLAVAYAAGWIVERYVVAKFATHCEETTK
jgi:uncharacterized membrane protein YhdT